MYWEGKVRLDKDLATGLQYCCYLLCRNPRSLEMFKDRPSNKTHCWRKAVTSELVSAQFPVIQGKYREFHWLWPQAPESGA